MKCDDDGHAELHLTLKDGLITVRHGFDFRKKDQSHDHVLLKVQTTGDSWNQIWDAIQPKISDYWNDIK